MSSAYIDPQPPDTSWTSSFVGCKPSLSFSKIWSSPSERNEGGSTADVDSAGDAEVESGRHLKDAEMVGEGRRKEAIEVSQ